MIPDLTPKVSVIIPVWNVEPYIGRCIESLQEQTLESIEMIFVDDCGSDASMALVEAAAEQDPRIRILHNEQNMGPGPARNTGIEAARGEYLSFVDPDDYVAPDFLGLLYTKAHAENLDIVKGTRAVLTHNKPASVARPSSRNGQMRWYLRKGYALFSQFIVEHQTGFFRREMILNRNVRFGDMRTSEDTVFLLQACYFANNFAFEDRATYYFVCRNDSSTHNFTSARTQAELDALAAQFGFLEQHEARSADVAHCLSQKLSGKLSYQISLSIQPDGADQAQDFLRTLRKLIEESSHRDLLVHHSIQAHALDAHGANLVEQEKTPTGEQPTTAGCLKVLTNWIDYVLAYPEDVAHCKAGHATVVGHAYRCYRNMGDANEAQAFLSDVDAQLDRLPRNPFSKLYFASWAVFPSHPRMSASLPARAWRKLRRKL